LHWILINGKHFKVTQLELRMGILVTLRLTVNVIDLGEVLGATNVGVTLSEEIHLTYSDQPGTLRSVAQPN